jgi:hypothetical protein
MSPIVFDVFSDMCASSVCLLLIIIIVAVLFIAIILWRLSGKKTVEIRTVEKSTKTGRYCPACGREIPFDAKICPYCGKNF